jgi:nicotinate-nucleotide adenylyltransferase
MLELAIENLPYIKISKIEVDRDPPSYMIDTLSLLQEGFSGYQFSLILGKDTLSRFEQWKEPNEIVKNTPLIVGNRVCRDEIPSFSTNPLIQKAIRDGIIETSVMEISATDIRDRINRGLYIEHLVPAKVVDYIYDNHLYCKD